jgi:hypothetical protein
MISFRTDFPFNGSRDYVHGPTLLEVFRANVLRLVNGAERTPFAFSFFRVNRLIQFNGCVAIYSAAEAGATSKSTRASAELACTAAGRDFYVGFYDEDPTPVRHRRDSYEKTLVRSVTASSSFHGAAELCGIRDNDELFQAVVEANKQVHLMTLTGDPWSTKVRFRFAYCLDYTCAPFQGGTVVGRVTTHNLATRDVGKHFFSLNQMDLEIGDFRSSFKLCFASTDIKIEDAGT